MIQANGQDVSEIYAGDKAVQKVYRGSSLVWENDPWLYMLNDSRFINDGVIKLIASDTYISAIVPVSIKTSVTITTVVHSSQMPSLFDTEIDVTKTIKTGYWGFTGVDVEEVNNTLKKYTKTHGFDNRTPGTKYILFSCAKEMYYYAKVVQNGVTLFDGAKHKPRK